MKILASELSLTDLDQTRLQAKPECGAGGSFYVSRLTH